MTRAEFDKEMYDAWYRGGIYMDDRMSRQTYYENGFLACMAYVCRTTPGPCWCGYHESSQGAGSDQK